LLRLNSGENINEGKEFNYQKVFGNAFRAKINKTM
jgi:hypothetical protein